MVNDLCATSSIPGHNLQLLLVLESCTAVKTLPHSMNITASLHVLLSPPLLLQVLHDLAPVLAELLASYLSHTNLQRLTPGEPVSFCLAP